MNNLKKICLYLCILTLIISSSPVILASEFAHDESYNYEFLLAPLVGASAGFIRCKDLDNRYRATCTILGGALGVVDEIKNYFGNFFTFYDKHYLTWGILGTAVARVLHMPLPVGMSRQNTISSTPGISDLIGITIGVLLPSGMLSKHQEMIAPVISAAAGNLMYGIPGLIAGGIAGALDQALVSNEITDNHYITFANVGMETISLLGYFPPSVAKFIGVGLGTLAAQYEGTIVDKALAPANVANNLYTTFSQIVPKETLDAYLEKQMLSLVGSRLVIELTSFKLLEYRQGLQNIFPKFEHPNPEAWHDFNGQFFYFAAFVIPCVMTETISSRINSYFAQNLYCEAGENIIGELFKGETALRISFDKNATVAMNNLNRDIITTTVNSGSRLLTDAVGASIAGTYGFAVIIVSSPSLFLYSASYHQVCNWISELLAKQRGFYGEKIITLESWLTSAFENDVKNVRTITERDGVNITRHKAQQIFSDLKTLQQDHRYWATLDDTWHYLTNNANWLFDYYLFSREVYLQRIPFHQSLAIQMLQHDAVKLLSWSGEHSKEIEQINQSRNRIAVLAGKIYIKPNETDKMERRVEANNNALVLRNVEIGFNDQPLVEIKDLRLERGKIYAITGRSGTGKTRFLYKLKGIKGDGSYAKGEIKYPDVNGKEPKIVMLSQEDYFPFDSSLYEVISYPDLLPTDPNVIAQQQEAIRALLQEAFVTILPNTTQTAHRIASMSFASKPNWYTDLSGGEKKRILLISALIKKPDILILDESFNGLDDESIIIIQKMLKRLPDTLVLVVDHNAKCHNFNSFYDQELYFKDKVATLRNI